MRVVIGMSGGVDSTVAALLIKEAGHDVRGLSLLMFESRRGTCARTASGSAHPPCCSREAIEDAAASCAMAGIPHSAVSVRDAFVAKVVEPFVRAYGAGRTPNPCILCNRHIKFPALVEHARSIGAEMIATGHYAQVEGGRLMRGVDHKKDQSYVLYAIGRETVGMLALPLGGMTKDRVREIARERGLPVFNRPESQEICFVEGGYPDLVSELSGQADEPGPLVDMDGNVIGAHKGISHYTLGQRKGLGVATGAPMFVTAIDTATRTVTIGQREAACKNVIEADDIVWQMEAPSEAFRATVKVRSASQPAPALVTPIGNAVRVEFDRPEFAPAPGQAAVFYDGEAVIGGGTINL